MAFWNQGGADFSNLKPALMPEEMGDVQEPAGFLESTGDSLQAGLMTTGTAAWQLATVPAIGADWVKSKATGIETTEQQDLMFSNIIDPAVQYVDSLSHKERTLAGSLSFGIGKVLTEFAGGGAPSMAVAEFSGRSTSEIRGGNSVMDANMLALNQAAWAYAGARLPGALGGSLTTKIASGAGINVVAGIGQRATEYGLMTMQGDARAADISVFGFQDMLVDAVLGAAFGPLDSARTKGIEKPDGRAIDGAMLMDRARFEDVQVGVRAPDVMAKVDRGIAEQVRAMQENRPALVERLPDEVTMPVTHGPVVSFKTAKGSTYEINPDGTTSRNKAARPEHPGEQGPQPASQRTFYVTPEAVQALGEIQAQGYTERRQIVTDGKQAGIRYMDGKDAGKFERRTVIDVQDAPSVGLIPVELWKDGSTVHFGNPIVEVSRRAVDAQRIAHILRDDAEITGLLDSPGKDIGDASEADIAALFGIKPDPDMKAMQAEITTLRDSQVDLSQPIVPDVDPAAVAELRAQAQAIEAERGAANDPDVAEATAFADRVKSIRDVMGCLLRIGA